MKHLLLWIFILAAGKAFSQVNSRNDTVKKYRNSHAPVIAAKDAYKYVGRMVVVEDSLYSGKIVNDSTVVCEMGEKTNTPRLTMVFIIEARFKPVDNRFIHTSQMYRLHIFGTITGSKDAPVLILHGMNNMGFTDRHRSSNF